MKRLISLLVLLSTISAVGATFSSQSFLSGTSVVIEQPANATALSVSGTSTAIKWTNAIGQIITAGTNAAGITYGAWSRPVTVFPDANANPASCNVSLTTPAGSSNTITLTFQRSIDGTSFDPDTTWAFTTVADTALSGKTTVTNVPTWFVTGAANLRCSSMSFATNSFGYTNAISSLRFNGFSP